MDFVWLLHLWVLICELTVVIILIQIIVGWLKVYRNWLEKEKPELRKKILGWFYKKGDKKHGKK